ncbi:MAG: phosphate regulon sensor histidine kinase PhoR [Betaproteobacteria bacterium HGW-Betaproteobacteria-3]|jgi:two-component system phosphate regulon sensor histidine kinase PhoR|nr:MAG: phosphate regulon sensor histidine kinase PhoR [Betaproteobacteria bacterium HGW-Betaproteobacteria-3]
MFFRLSTFIAFLLVGGAAGYILSRQFGAITGVACASVAWFAWDLSRGLRVLRWLRSGDTPAAPQMRGVWGLVADRMRRLLRQREAAATQSAAQLREFLAALQASPNGVVLLDAEGRIEWCNETAAAHFGIDAARDLQQHIRNLVRDPVFATYYASEDYRGEVVMAGRASTPARPVRVSVHLHPYGDGRRLLLSRDVTALEQAEAMRRDFVANVSHEIRTPLTVLSGFVETLQTLPLDEADRTRYLGLMAQQSARMQTLVNDLLTLSRLEGSPAPGWGDWITVTSLLQSCEQEGRALSVAVTQGQGATHELHFEAAMHAASGWEVSGSHNELFSAMSNLLSNAVRYTPPAGRIDVSWVMAPDGSARYAVRDTGPGIAPEHLSRLTERFYRVDRSRSRESGGTGLGLAIVKHVLQRHGAALQIESTPGVGSIFTIVFPAGRLRRATPADAAPVTAPVAQAAGE